MAQSAIAERGISPVTPAAIRGLIESGLTVSDVAELLRADIRAVEDLVRAERAGRGTGWVCESHPTVPIGSCKCGAATMLCECNEEVPPGWRSIMRVVD